MSSPLDDELAVPTTDEELTQLRRRAAQLGIEGYAKMTADQLRTAVAERHRGADPHQAETVARHRESE